MNKPVTTTSFEFIAAWFEKAQANATLQGKKDSAMLWKDGLEHLYRFKSERDELLAALKYLVQQAGLSDLPLPANNSALLKARDTIFKVENP